MEFTTIWGKITTKNRYNYPSWIEHPLKNVKKTPSIHAFMLFLDELAQEKDIEEVSFWLAEVLYAFLQSEISKSGPKNWFSK